MKNRRIKNINWQSNDRDMTELKRKRGVENGNYRSKRFSKNL